MLEALTDWEQVLKLNPSVDDSDQERRARVAAKLRGLINNALPDIEATAKKALGVNFGAVVLVDPANHYVYSPANVPGPPGFEWSSSRAVVGIRMTQSGLNLSPVFGEARGYDSGAHKHAPELDGRIRRSRTNCNQRRRFWRHSALTGSNDNLTCALPATDNVSVLTASTANSWRANMAKALDRVGGSGGVAKLRRL